MDPEEPPKQRTPPPGQPSALERAARFLRPRRGPKVILPPGTPDLSPDAKARRLKTLAGWGIFVALAVFILYKAFTIRPTEYHPPPRIEAFVATGNRDSPDTWNVLLTWATSNAESVEITPHVGTVEPKGRANVQIRQDTTFLMTATGPGGKATYELEVKVTE